MVLELLVQDWRVHGEESLALSLGAMTAELAERTDEGAYDEIFERITRDLDAASQNVLNLASILGPRVNDLAMYSMIDLGIGQTISGLTTLTGRRVLRDGGRGLEFTNELVRASAYRRVPSTIRRLLHSQVADRLIEASKKGLRTQGLETAWHCMRAGRAAEGIPFLIDGAAEAIQQGAPHEAERALRTGLPSVPHDLKTRAIILLATALQEQAAWQDARYEVLTLAIKARRWAGALDAHEIQRDLDTLAGIVRSARHPAIRVRAIGLAATLTNFTRMKDQAGLVYALAEAVPEAGLHAHDRAELSRAKALLAFHLGDSQASLTHLQAALGVIVSTGLASSLAVSVHMGSGVHACLQGRYEDAIQHHKFALQAAMRLGNDPLISASCGNLAVCCGRLGARRDQLDWAQRALAYQGGRFEGYTELHAAFWAALGHTAMDNRIAALDTMARVDTRMPDSAPQSIRSVWALMKADILWALGREGLARTTAREGLGSEPIPHFEGRYARWLAATAMTRDELMQAQLRVETLVAGLARFDAVDQAEILAAAQMICHALGRPSDARARALADAVQKLPPLVGAELARFATMATCYSVSLLAVVSTALQGA
jgi:tetratricopeptide (TPR) repeat protein